MLMLRNWGLPRPLRWTTAALLGALLGCGGLRAADEPDNLSIYLDAASDADAIEQAQQKLLAQESQPLVAALAKLLQSDKTDSAARLRIIGLLGALKTDVSAALLQKICTQSTLTILDIGDWGNLARSIQAGSSSDESDLSSRIWKRLSVSERKSVEQLAAADTNAAGGGAAGLALLTGLNRILADESLCTEADLSKLPISEDAQHLAERWRNRKKTDALPEDRFTANEYRQLNDYLLHGQFKAALQFTFVLPAHQYESRTANAAIAELMKMTGQPVAEAAIIAMDPDPYQARQHLDALGAIRSQAATERLFQYLKCDAVSASNRARDLLKDRLQEDATTVESLLLEMMNKYMYAEDNQESLPDSASRNLLALAVALPNEASRRDIMARCLGLKDKVLRAAAFGALKQDAKLVHYEEIRQALSDRLAEDNSAECALQTVEILQLSQDAEALPLLAAQLEHESQDVRVKAARAMEMLTGKHLGANPAVWKKWWADTHPAAEEQP